MKASRRSAVPPFAVMDILGAVAARRAAGLEVYSLCAGEPSGGAPADVRQLAEGVMAANTPLSYTAPLGQPELRSEIAGHYERWYGIAVDPAQVAITTGSSGAFVLAFLAAFDAGDRVAVARPGYPAYRNILSSLGIEVVDLPCGEATRYQPTPELLDRAVAEGGPLAGLVIASPANPTGTMVDEAEMAALVAWCEEHDTRLVSDEIYHGITYGATRGATAWAHGRRDSVVVSSFSKYWGMTGWRLGWALLPPELVVAVDALAGNLALSPPSLAQLSAVAGFTDATYLEADAAVEQYRQHRDLVLARVDRLGWGATAPADGAFYVYADISSQIEAADDADSVAWCKRLLDDTGVALTPGTDFDPIEGGGWVRLSFAASADVLTEALDRIEAWAAR